MQGPQRTRGMKNLISYWRNSLADAGRVSPGQRELRDADQKGLRLSVTDFTQGRVEAPVAEQLFRAWREKRSEGKEEDGPTSIPVTIYPLVYGTLYDHGEARNERAQQLHVPLSVGAKLERDGRLVPLGQDAVPLITRDFLEPSSSDVVIGSLEAADAFYTKHSSPMESWQQTVQLARKLVEEVGKQSFDALILDGTERLDYGLVMPAEPPPQSRTIINTYDLLSGQNEAPPLLHRLAEGVDDEGLLDQQELISANAAHLGQMTDRFALFPSQREALAHCLNAFGRSAEILAVNGPPGTGKTTLIQSLVATLWVKAAVEETNCPIIVAAGATNQSATNVIQSFGMSDSIDDDPLGGHWIPGVASLGMFMPAKGADRKDWQVYDGTNDHFAKPFEALEALAKNRASFLERFARAFPGKPADDLAGAKRALHAELLSATDSIQAVVETAGWLIGRTPGSPFSIAECHQRRAHINADLERKTQALRELKDRLQSHFSLELEWARHLGSEPLWMSFLSFLGPVKRRQELRDNRFVLARRMEKGFGWLDGARSREEVGRSIRSAIATLRKDVSRAEDSEREAEELLASYDQHLGRYERWCGDRGIDGGLEGVCGALDVGERYRAFRLARHYWEASYLLEVEDDLRTDYEDKKSTKRLTRQYRRLAKLAPCFVMTLHMLPKRFTSWRDRDELMQKVIDLLIVDEAGQAAPDIGAASFIFASRALVVGDTNQVEPVWNIPEAIDRANARKCLDLDGGAYEVFAQSGQSANGGSLMTMAQRASRHTKFPDVARGMFLSQHKRCFDDIVAYCNELFYKGHLSPLRGRAEQPWMLPPIGFANIDGTDRPAGGSRTNEQEAEVIAAWIKERREQLEDHYGQPISDILGIVTPFAAQSRTIATCLRQRGLPVGRRGGSGITVGTVHALQGSERKIVIFSPTYGRDHSRGTFFGRQPKMLNVAVSRAEDSFLVFGHMRLFGSRVPDRASRLLGTFLFKPENEITDIQPVVPIESPPPASQLIRHLDGHRALLRDALDNATRRVTIVSPFLAEKAMAADEVEDRVRRATDRGVSVAVFTDPKQTSSSKQFEKCLAALRRAGAAIFLADKEGVHSKLLWSDDRLLAIGSFNWLSARRDDHPFRRYEASAVYHGEDAGTLIRQVEKDLRKLCKPSA